MNTLAWVARGTFVFDQLTTHCNNNTWMDEWMDGWMHSYSNEVIEIYDGEVMDGYDVN